MPTNEQIRVTNLDLASGLRVATGRAYRLLLGRPRGHIAAFLFDQDLAEPLVGHPYEIVDADVRPVAKGSTDTQGCLMHPNLLAGYYTLKTSDGEYPVPTLQVGDDPYVISVLGEQVETDSEGPRGITHERRLRREQGLTKEDVAP